MTMAWRVVLVILRMALTIVCIAMASVVTFPLGITAGLAALLRTRWPVRIERGHAKLCDVWLDVPCKVLGHVNRAYSGDVWLDAWYRSACIWCGTPAPRAPDPKLPPAPREPLKTRGPFR